MTAEHIAQAFRQARQSATALPAYPAPEVPPSLDAAYAIQDVAIAAWPDRVAGWKVAAIQPAWRAAYPAERLGGPVFTQRLVHAGNSAIEGAIDCAIIDGGYAAVEAEFALLLGTDFPLHTVFETEQQLLPYVAAVHGAVELAGSPLLNLGALGPGAVISDFGNNTGLIVGPALDDFFARPLDQWRSETQLNGVLAGQGGADRIPGGPLAALFFLANHMVSRGASLHPGEWISTGASTGIHLVAIGDQVEVSFDGKPVLSLHIVKAVAAAG